MESYNVVLVKDHMKQKQIENRSKRRSRRKE